MKVVIQETGQVYGRLTVTAREGIDSWGNARWRCRCECGREVVTLGTSLRKGDTRSCGCWNLELSRARIMEYNNAIKS